MIDLTKLKRSVAGLQSELSLHGIIFSWQVYYVESEPWRHITWKNQKIARSPHILGVIKRMHKQVPGAPPFFAHAGDKAISWLNAETLKNALPFLTDL